MTASYEVLLDRIELTVAAGSTMTARRSSWNLTFTKLANYPGCRDVTVWTTQPWVLTTLAGD